MSEPESLRRRQFQRRKAAAVKEKGLLIVFTGSGKGKSTAAFGMGLRVLGHGMRLGVVQFIKGALPSAERDFLSCQKDCFFLAPGDGYTWNKTDRLQNVLASERAWAEAVKLIASPDYAMVILDELNIVLKQGLLDLPAVLSVLSNRRSDLHIVVTGRQAPAPLLEMADLVTEMRCLKHPYLLQGVKAQKGVEF